MRSDGSGYSELPITEAATDFWRDNPRSFRVFWYPVFRTLFLGALAYFLGTYLRNAHEVGEGSAKALQREACLALFLFADLAGFAWKASESVRLFRDRGARFFVRSTGEFGYHGAVATSGGDDFSYHTVWKHRRA
jgi:hypothetical protein